MSCSVNPSPSADSMVPPMSFVVSRAANPPNTWTSKEMAEVRNCGSVDAVKPPTTPVAPSEIACSKSPSNSEYPTSTNRGSRTSTPLFSKTCV